MDLTTGAGLDAALAGADVVVNAVNEVKKGAVLTNGTGRLLTAEHAAGVRHHVDIGVVGADRVPLAYYRAKLEQEEVVRNASVPWTIVRSTQFHEFLAWAFASAERRHVLPGGRVPLEPVAAVEVARAIADVAEQDPRQGTFTIAGPRVEPLSALVRSWRAGRPGRVVVIPVPGVNRATRTVRAGGLTVATTPDVRGTTTFASWLETHV